MVIIEQRVPAWFWVVSILALLWNAMGLWAYIAEVFRTPEALAQLPEFDRAMLAARPAWVTAAFAVAVHAGFLGAVLLLMRRRMAQVFFVLSLLGIIAQDVYYFVLNDALGQVAAERLIMPVVVLVIAVLLIIFSRISAARGWLR